MRFFEPFARAGGYVPLTERLLPRGRRSRLIAVAVLAAFPFIQLVTFTYLSARAGLEPDPVALIQREFVNRLLNAYLIVLTIWGAGWAAAQLRVVASLSPKTAWSVAGWPTWLAAPVALDLAFGVMTEIGHAAAVGYDRAVVAPAPFAASFALSFVIRLPQLVAFWTAVVALLATARLGGSALPAAFPDDRALGLRPVGELVFRIFLTYAAAFLPGFVIGTFSAPDLYITVGLFGTGLAAMLLATWRVHELMAGERERAVRAARARYAEAYRSAEVAPAASPARAGERLSLAEALLHGAESIHEWPLDERTQRIAAVVLTGAFTGIVVRAILLSLGV